MATTAKKIRPKNKLYIALLNGFVFIVTIAAIWFIVKNYLHINDKTYVDDAQVKAYINPINSRVPGYIKEIRFEEHQLIKRGDTLLVLDNAEFINAVAQAQAGLTQAIANKASAQSSVNRASVSENTVEANILGAQAQLDNAKADLVRYQ